MALAVRLLLEGVAAKLAGALGALLLLPESPAVTGGAVVLPVPRQVARVYYAGAVRALNLACLLGHLECAKINFNRHVAEAHALHHVIDLMFSLQ